MRVKRKHHYVPVFYLSEFTDPCDSRGTFHVFDLKTRNAWESSPDGIGYGNDFHRIDAPGVDPNIIEDMIAHIEARQAAAIKRIRATSELPKDSDSLAVFINLVAMLIARVPSSRDCLSDSMADFERRVARIIFAHDPTPDEWKAFVADMRDKGIEVDDATGFVGMRRFDESGEYTVAPTRNWLVTTMLDTAKCLFPLLARRNWTLVVARDCAGDFISSDNPVSLHWSVLPPTGLDPAYGFRNTTVCVPLNRRMVALGRFEESPRRLEADNAMVSRINTYTLIFARRFVFSAQPEFECMRPDGSTARGTEWPVSVRASEDTA
jgi:hypothetical protein